MLQTGSSCIPAQWDQGQMQFSCHNSKVKLPQPLSNSSLLSACQQAHRQILQSSSSKTTTVSHNQTPSQPLHQLGIFPLTAGTAQQQQLPVFTVTGGMLMPVSAQQQLPGPHQQPIAQFRGHQLAGQQHRDSLQSNKAWQTFETYKSAGENAGIAEKNLPKAFLAEASLFQQGLDLVAERLVQTQGHQNILEDMLRHVHQDKELPTYIESNTADCSEEKTRLDVADGKWQQKQNHQISLTQAATKAYQAAAALRSTSTEEYEAAVKNLTPSQTAPHLVSMYAAQQAAPNQPFPGQSYQPFPGQSYQSFPAQSQVPHFMGAPSQVSPEMLPQQQSHFQAASMQPVMPHAVLYPFQPIPAHSAYMHMSFQRHGATPQAFSQAYGIVPQHPYPQMAPPLTVSHQAVPGPTAQIPPHAQQAAPWLSAQPSTLQHSMYGANSRSRTRLPDFNTSYDQGS